MSVAAVTGLGEEVVANNAREQVFARSLRRERRRASSASAEYEESTTVLVAVAALRGSGNALTQAAADRDSMVSRRY